MNNNNNLVAKCELLNVKPPNVIISCTKQPLNIIFLSCLCRYFPYYFCDVAQDLVSMLLALLNDPEMVLKPAQGFGYSLHGMHSGWNVNAMMLGTTVIKYRSMPIKVKSNNSCFWLDVPSGHEVGLSHGNPLTCMNSHSGVVGFDKSALKLVQGFGYSLRGTCSSWNANAMRLCTTF